MGVWLILPIWTMWTMRISPVTSMNLDLTQESND